MTTSIMDTQFLTICINGYVYEIWHDRCYLYLYETIVTWTLVILIVCDFFIIVQKKCLATYNCQRLRSPYNTFFFDNITNYTNDTVYFIIGMH